MSCKSPAQGDLHVPQWQAIQPAVAPAPTPAPSTRRPCEPPISPRSAAVARPERVHKQTSAKLLPSQPPLASKNDGRGVLTRSPHLARESPQPPPQPSFRLAIKDNIATLPADGPTTCASHILAGHDSPYEATIVTQLKRRGASVVGKTNLDEFGMGAHSANSAHGPVAQEQAQELPRAGGGDDRSARLISAGGSSGGSALAVAAGAADLALGTDTGGSVRLPAAYCGVVGYKPSYGMISRYGVVPYANSLDTVGFLARDVGVVRDLVVGPDGLYAEHDPRDPTSLSTAARRRCGAGRAHYGMRAAEAARAGEDLLRGLTFGVPAEYNVAELAAPVRRAWASAAALLRDALGARVVPVSLPSTCHALSAYYVIAPAEASSNLAKYDGVRYGPRQHEIEGAQQQQQQQQEEEGSPAAPLYSAVRGQGFGPEVKRRILLGSYTLSSEAVDNYFVQAQRVRRLVRRDFDRVFRLANPLLDEGDPSASFDLSDLDEAVSLDDKRGPPQVDFLLCPTAPTLPPTLDEVQRGQKERPVDAYVNDVFTVPASLAGLPAVSIPRRIEADAVAEGDGDGGAGVMGLQIIGQYWDDARMLAVADALSAFRKS